MAERIHDIIECSIKTVKVPKEWKRGDVMPINKNGNKEESLNYRPVSLTSIVCKICEKVIKKQWNEYLEREGIITDRQFGFRTGRSCVTNLLSFYFKIDRYNTRKWLYIFRLKKGIWRLLWKLEHIGGLKGTLKNWMEDYLKGREMRKIGKDEKLEWREVKSGASQGLVLAPIMFLIYVNDMIEGVSSYISLFADDTQITKKDRKSQGLWGTTKWLKHGLWMEQDMGNGI